MQLMGSILVGRNLYYGEMWGDMAGYGAPLPAPPPPSPSPSAIPSRTTSSSSTEHTVGSL